MMMQFAVVWHEEAAQELTAVYDQSGDRAGLLAEVERAESLRRFQVGEFDQHNRSSLRCVAFGPLEVFFEISELDRAVQIVHVRTAIT